MPRGGFRPGAGRPKKSALKVGGKAPAVVPDLPADITGPAVSAGLSPLEYMLAVMRDDGEEDARRDRMAMAAAPYLHQRAAELGKKDAAKEAAEAVAGGKFRARAAPKLRVVNG